MLRSMFAGISGLKAHQQMMDVTGNNIANVNTTGFKSSQAVFQDTLSQMIRGAGAPVADDGGTNPAQIGLGVRLGGITTNFTQGSAQTTGRSTDLMINGDGFFVVQSGAEQLYTRAGAFSFDANGNLVTNEGAKVMGWNAQNGLLDTNGAAEPIQMQTGTLLPPVATSAAVDALGAAVPVKISGNLPADAALNDTLTPSITVYDAQGNAAQLTVTLRYTDTNADSTPDTWEGTLPGGGTFTLGFDANGQTPVTTPNPVAVSEADAFGDATLTGSIALDFSGLTNYAGKATVAALSQGGSAMGSLQGFSITADGTLIGTFTNGLKQPLGQVAMASFNNAPGLEKAGNSTFRASVNSGLPQLGVAGAGGRGELQGGSLEMSNVDLAQEFTGLIIAQRGFQANSKVISTSDELLGDLVNLKR